MELDQFLTLARLWLDSGGYLLCISWLAWEKERTTGFDAFDLVLTYIVGISISFYLVEGLRSSPYLALFLGAGIAFLLHRFIRPGSSERSGETYVISSLLFSIISLSVFAWLTSHTPLIFDLANKVDSSIYLSIISIVVVVLVSYRSSISATKLRAGQWEVIYLSWWSGKYVDIRRLPFAFSVVNFFCWSVVIATPLSTTGVVSSSILQDVLLAILITRIVSSNGLATLTLLSLSIGLIRVLPGYFLISETTTALVNTLILLVFFLWITRDARMSWLQPQ